MYSLFNYAIHIETGTLHFHKQINNNIIIITN